LDQSVTYFSLANINNHQRLQQPQNSHNLKSFILAMANMSEKVNQEEPLFLKYENLDFSDEDLEWVLTHLKISKEDLDKKSIYVKRFIHEEILPSYILSEDEDDACEALIKLNNFERVHDSLSLGSKFDRCKYFQLTKRFPDVYYELCQSFYFRDVNDAGYDMGYDMESMAVQNFCKYAYKYRVFKEKRSKYNETVAYMQAKGVENQLLVDERTALHTQLLNSGASHKRFKTNVSAYISKKNILIRDLQTRFSELESKNKDLTEQLLACRAAKSVSDTQLEECKDEKEDLAEQLSHTQSLLLQSIASRESLSKELTEQLLACIAAKDVSAAQLEECEAEKEDLTEQLCHTQSLLLQSIASIGKRKRVE
jgi:hypothetical protein